MAAPAQELIITECVTGKRVGRRSTYTPELASQICERLAEGESLLAICECEDMPAYSTVMLWLHVHPAFSEDYARARSIHADQKFDEIQSIADDARNDWMLRNDPENPGYYFNGEHIQRSKLRVDTLKWRLGRMAPKKYGDHATLELTGAGGGPLASVNLNVTDPIEAARVYQSLIVGK